MLATIACGSGGDSDADREIEPDAIKIAESTRSESAALREQRAELDETVWKHEKTAQEYEATIVRLWDELRGAENAIAVLSSFPFEKLTLGSAGTTENLDHGIARWHGATATRDLDPREWQQLLDDYARRGWKLIQSEWHHSRFVPSEGEPPRSEFGIVLHAENAAEQRRVSIEGTIEIVWQDARDANGNWMADEIDASSLELLERRGAPAFSERQELGRKPEFDIFEKDLDMSGTVVAHDLDGDGRDEILVPAANRAFWNQGGWKFEERSLLAQTPALPLGTAVVADFTGDGVADLLGAAVGGWPLLYRGEPGGAFPHAGEKVEQVGERLMQPMVFAVGDIDGDADLDVWLTDYKRPYYEGGEMPTPYFDANDGFASHLLVNRGDGTFENRTEQAGLAPKRYRRTYSTSFIDLDEDGDLDLVVVSDFSGADVYLNDGAGRFSDVTDRVLGERASFGMAGLFSDFNLDGALDFYMVGMSSTTARRLDRLGLGRSDFPEHQAMRPKMGYGNRMYFGDADHALREVDLGSALARTGWSWGTVALDFDLDADPDIYVANGHLSRTSAQDYCTDFWKHDIYTEAATERERIGAFLEDAKRMGMSWNGFEHNRLLMNVDGSRFVETGFLMGVAIEDDSRMVVAGDFDSDGRPDLLVSTRSDAPNNPVATRISRIWLEHNTLAHDRHWLGVRLAGARSPIGARIEVASGDRRQLHYVVIGDGFRSQQPFARVFGLGARDAVDYIEVTYPGGQRARIDRPAIDRYHVVADADTTLLTATGR